VYHDPWESLYTYCGDCIPEETVQAVAQCIAQDEVGTLIVVEVHKPVGIITETG